MKLNFSFSKLLDNNKFVKLISLITAIIVWFFVVITIDPTEFISVNNIPVDFSLSGTMPEAFNLSVIEGGDQTVNIKVKGKKYKLGNLSKYDFIGVPTLNSVKKAGEYEIRVDVKKVNEKDTDYSVESEPKTIKVKFDRLLEKTLPIHASAENIKAEEGFVKVRTDVSPDKITLKGPKSEIDKIAKCSATTDENEVASDTKMLPGKLKFYDINNNELVLKYTPKYTLNINEKYEITIAIHKHKIVPLKVNFVNVPQGLDVSKLKYKLSAESIEIVGPKNIINETKEIQLNAIDFRKIDVGSTFLLEVNLPAGIDNINKLDNVNLDIDDAELDSKQFTVKNILTKNEPANYNIKLKTTTISNVKFVGNKLDMEKLSANDLIAIVDFSAEEISVGSSRVPVTIYATGNKFAWAVGEYFVLVNATKTSQ